jgi:glycosyltransferase involved in cell wall biosynthesis
MRNKIAIVCNSTNSDLVEYFRCKVSALNKSEFKNNFIALKNQKIDLDDDIRAYNSSFTSSAFFDKKVPLDFLVSFYMFFVVLTNKVKVVHFTTAHISNLFLSILLKPFRIKQIFTIHDISPHPGKKAIFINIYNKVVINFLSDEIISFSKSEINKQNKKNKFKYFVLSGFSQYINKPKTGEKTILFFGRIEKYKGLNNLLDLIVKVNKANLGYKFIIAGKGKIKNIEEFQKFNNVEILNRFITDDEVMGLFEKATFTILPYDSATQSGVIVLSFAHATPVIAYGVGSLNEYIINEKNGFVVGYRDNDSIVNILKKLSDKDIIKLSQNCISTFLSNFSKNACKEMYLDYYRKKLVLTKGDTLGGHI